MVRLSVSSGEVVFSDDSGALVWSGKPLGHDAMLVLPMGGSTDAIVLLNADGRGARSFQNLLRVSRDGSVVWRADLPESNDDYVAVKWGVADQLLANTWSGYNVRLDPESGRILDKIFTK